MSLVQRGELGRCAASQAADAVLAAAEAGNADVVRFLLESRWMGNHGQQATTALHCAAELGHTDALCVLVDKGFDLEAADEMGMTALYVAAANNHTAAVEALLAAGANIDARDERGLTPLACAVRGSLPEMANLLIEHGARHTLHTAAGLGDVEELSRLLAAGADINATDDEGVNALQWAARAGQAEAAGVLIAAGADPNVAHDGGATPLHFAAHNSGVEVTHILLKAGAVVDAKGGGMRRPLYYAVHECPEVAVALVEAGANVRLDASDPHDTPLVHAAQGGDLNLVRAMLMRGAAADYPAGATCDTPLHAAARGGHWEVFEALIDAGLDPLASGRRETVADAAVWGGSTAIAELLVRLGAWPTGWETRKQRLLHLALNLRHYDMARLFIVWGADCTMHAAAALNDVDELDRLLAQSGNITDRDPVWGWTPLTHAAYHDAYQAAVHLIDHGADVDDNTERDTPLTLAAKSGRLDMVKLLVGAGADVNARGHAGRTALHEAASYYHVSTVEALLASGANANLLDDDGTLPADLAIWDECRGDEPEMNAHAMAARWQTINRLSPHMTLMDDEDHTPPAKMN